MHAAPGAAGGYRLGAGVSGIEETSLRALRKLEQMLPSRLRRRVNALHGSTVSIAPSGPSVDAGVLTAIAAAVRDRERLRFDYEPSGEGDGGGLWTASRTGSCTRAAAGTWSHGIRMAIAGACSRPNRIRPRTHTGPRFGRREDPDGDLATFVERELGTAMWSYRARVRVHAPAARVAARVPPPSSSRRSTSTAASPTSAPTRRTCSPSGSA